MLVSTGKWRAVLLVLLCGGACNLVLADDAPTSWVCGGGSSHEIGSSLPFIAVPQSQFAFDTEAAESLMSPSGLVRVVGISSLSEPKAFPAVPKSLFLSVVGFLCVSLVRDRRVWLAAAATIVTCGLYCIDAIPGRLFHSCGPRHACHMSHAPSLPQPWQLGSLFVASPCRSARISDRADQGHSISAHVALWREFDLLFPYSFPSAGHTHMLQPQLAQRLAARSPPLGAHPRSVAEALSSLKGRCAQGLWAC